MNISGPAPVNPAPNVQNVHPTTSSQPVRDTTPAQPETVRPPHGVDPELWQMLTSDEQAFFATQSVLGPLTYGPVQEVPAADAPRGQRIDVRA